MTKESPPEEEQLEGTEQEVKLSLTGANSYRLPGPYELGETVKLLITGTVTLATKELLDNSDEGPHTRPVVHIKVDRLVETKR